MKLGRTQKVLLTAAAATTAISVAGVGTYAGWTTAQSRTQNVSSGSFALLLGGADNTATTLTSVSNLAPGDTATRYFSVQNDGSLDFGSLKLAIDVPTSTNSDKLFDGTSKGLQYDVDACTVAWTDGACTGTGATQSSVVTAGPATDVAAASLDPLAAGATTHLKVVLSLPSTTGDGGDSAAPNSDYSLYGNKTGTISWTVSATQRDATAR